MALREQEAQASPSGGREELDGLVQALRRGLGDPANTDADPASRAADIVRKYLPSQDVLNPSQLAGDPSDYVQHVLHVEPDGSFSVVALVWRPGQLTPVHDHVSWCVVGVIAGCELEERFETTGRGGLALAGRITNDTGEVCGFAPPGDIHRVRNPGPSMAVSLHVYGADISKLGSSVRRVYDLEVG